MGPFEHAGILKNDEDGLGKTLCRGQLAAPVWFLLWGPFDSSDLAPDTGHTRRSHTREPQSAAPMNRVLVLLRIFT